MEERIERLFRVIDGIPADGGLKAALKIALDGLKEFAEYNLSIYDYDLPAKLLKIEAALGIKET